MRTTNQEDFMPDIDQTVTVRRSELVCAAHSLKMMSKAVSSEADEVIFDLEDGCAPSQKVAARKILIEAFRTLDFQGKIRAFRANGIHSEIPSGSEGSILIRRTQG